VVVSHKGGTKGSVCKSPVGHGTHWDGGMQGKKKELFDMFGVAEPECTKIHTHENTMTPRKGVHAQEYGSKSMD